LKDRNLSEGGKKMDFIDAIALPLLMIFGSSARDANAAAGEI
jgi:hypothetical protein